VPLPALIILAIFAVAIIWVVIRVLRVPKRPEHERAPEKMRDPALTAFKSGSGK
jgi:uncharacterized membrane protein SpoIIM required for sporulation